MLDSAVETMAPPARRRPIGGSVEDGSRIRVLLVDDHAVVRMGLKSFFDLLDDIEVVGEASDGSEGVAMARRLKPDVVLMDLLMPNMDGVTAIGRIKAELAVIRERTVAVQGYDTFRDDIVLTRGREILEEFITADMEQRKERLLDVAVQMMKSQRVIDPTDERQAQELRARFDDRIRAGRLHGLAAALELFYQRR